MSKAVITSFLFIFCLFISASIAEAASRTCTKAEKAAADKQLWLNAHDKDVSLEKHLPWGMPEPDSNTTNERLLVQRDYVINYDDDLRIPIWTAQVVDSKKLKTLTRINCFRADPRAAAATSAPSDYDEPIFDQGHMTPNGDMTLSNTAIINSFVMTNMTPQYCQLNRGIWQDLETLVRFWAKKYRRVYVLSGSVLDSDEDGTRDPDSDAERMQSNNGKERVAVATAFYKVLVREEEDSSLSVLTILLPHDQTDVADDDAFDYLNDHVSSIAAIEKVTGLDILPDAEGEIKEADKLWSHEGAKVHTLVNADCRETLIDEDD